MFLRLRLFPMVANHWSKEASQIRNMKYERYWKSLIFQTFCPAAFKNSLLQCVKNWWESLFASCRVTFFQRVITEREGMTKEDDRQIIMLRMMLFNENAFDVVNYLSLGYKCFYRRYTTLAVATERCVTVLAPFTHIKVKYIYNCTSC